MTAETALWILGVSVPALLTWGVWLSWVVLRVRSDAQQMLVMHKDPDKYGFGTLSTNEFVKALTTAINGLTHYIRWDIEDRTGKRPPPPM